MAISHFLVAILDLCKLAYFPCRDFSGLLVCWSWDLREMHCGKKNSVAVSFLKNASLPGLRLTGPSETWPEIVWSIKVLAYWSLTFHCHQIKMYLSHYNLCTFKIVVTMLIIHFCINFILIQIHVYFIYCKSLKYSGNNKIAITALCPCALLYNPRLY